MDGAMIIDTAVETELDALQYAMKVIAKGLKKLPRQDREDFGELWDFLWSEDASEEDIEAAKNAIVEILTRKTSRIQAIPLLSNGSQSLAKYRRIVGAKIRELRKAANLTQEQLAEKAGILQGYISRLEKDEHSPSHKTLAKIADALGVAVTELDPTCDGE